MQKEPVVTATHTGDLAASPLPEDLCPHRRAWVQSTRCTKDFSPPFFSTSPQAGRCWEHAFPPMERLGPGRGVGRVATSQDH